MPTFIPVLPHRRLMAGLGTMCVCGLLTTSNLVAQDSVQGIVRRSVPAVVLVSVFDRANRAPFAIGSGFFIDKNGLVATNLHVVARAHRATVTLASGESYDVVGFVAVDPRSDAVLLTIRHPVTASLTLANSDSLSSGAQVVAIGSPEGFQSTVSNGVASGIRIMDGVAWLQHSAPTSHGSSGGPLLDSRGYVVGMVQSSFKNAQNLNFAVPSNAIRALRPADSVSPLDSLPTVEESFGDSAPDFGLAPSGLTNLYLFGYPVGGYDLVFLIELQTGRLSGAVFSTHPSGFSDIIPISQGQRPGVSRDFDFWVGCYGFSGWLRNKGGLTGNVSGCGDQPGRPAFEAMPFSSDPQRVRSFRGAKLWYLHLTSEGDSLLALLATVGPKKTPEATVGALHAWRPSPAGHAIRYTINYPRGRAAPSGDTLVLVTANFADTIYLRELDGAVAGRITRGKGQRDRYSVVGVRFDLSACMQPAGLKVMSARGRLRIARDSVSDLKKLLVMLPLGDRKQVSSHISVQKDAIKAYRDTLRNAPAEFADCPGLVTP